MKPKIGNRNSSIIYDFQKSNILKKQKWNLMFEIDIWKQFSYFGEPKYLNIIFQIRDLKYDIQIFLKNVYDF